MNKKMWAALLAAVMMMSLSTGALAEAAYATPRPVQQMSEAATITVQGTAQIMADPDEVSVTANASVSAATVGSAQEAMNAIAKLAVERKTGARGLRAIMEEIMTGIMFDIPSDPTIQSVLITEQCVREQEKPQVTRDSSKPRKPIRNAGVTL